MRRLLTLLVVMSVLSAHTTASVWASEPVSKPKLGFVMVTYGFDAVKKNPSTNEFVYVEGLQRVQKISKVKAEAVQIPLFPGNLDDKGFPVTKELFGKLKQHAGEVVPILMLTEDPLDPEKKGVVTAMLVNGFKKTGGLGVKVCSSTSFEAWMKGTAEGAKPLTGRRLDAAVAQLVEIHAAAITQARKEGCKVEHLDMEYLRPVEFVTFTNAEKAWRVVNGINQKLGYPFVRLLDDSAHAGDSGLTVDRINVVRAQAAAAKAYGTFHFSEPTTRGLIGSGSPYATEALGHAYRHGRLSNVFVEIFDPLGPETELMRKHIPGYGKVTFQDPAEAIADGLLKAQNRLDQLARPRPLR